MNKAKTRSGFVSTSDLYEQIEALQEENKRLRLQIVGEHMAPVMQTAQIAEILFAHDHNAEIDAHRCLGESFQDAFDIVWEEADEDKKYYELAKQLTENVAKDQ